MTKEQLQRLFKAQANNRISIRERVEKKYKERFKKIFDKAVELNLLNGDYNNKLIGLYRASELLCGYNFFDYNEFTNFVLGDERKHWCKQGSGVSSGMLVAWAVKVYIDETKKIKKMIKN